MTRSPPDDPKNHSFVFANAIVIDGRPPPSDPVVVEADAFCAWNYNTSRVGPPTPPVYPDQQLDPGPVSFFPYPVRDPNNLPLTFSTVLPLPASLQIDPATGEIYGTLDDLDWDRPIGQVQVSNGAFSITGPVFRLYYFATGGVETRATVYGIEYGIHTFQADSFGQTGQAPFKFIVNRNIPYAEYLVVGGGGGGGSVRGGGGGAGGLKIGTTSFGIGEFDAAVGNGGLAGVSGSDSALGSGVIALGGGFGGSSTTTGIRAVTGGSGGGGGTTYAYNTIINNAVNTVVTNNHLGAAGTEGQGNAGANGSPGNSSGGLSDPSIARRGGGGGGGAGAPGTAGVIEAGGNGGNGVGLTFPGTLTYFAGGGGGSTNGYTQGTGGLGGGGSVTGLSVNGTPGTGGGGAGGTSSVGGAGGSGVIIVRYPLYPEPTGIKRFGLIQWLDAQDYTSGAINWNDRTANYDVSLFNSPVKDATDGGGSIIFNGTTNLGTYDTPTEIAAVTSFSLELWAKWTTTGSTTATIQTILDNSSTVAEPSFVLQDRPDLGKALAFEYRQSSGSTTLLSGTQVGDGNWHHIVVSCDFNTPTVRMFIDGDLANSVLSPSIQNRVIKPLSVIGRWDSGASRYYSGKLAVFRSYSRALTIDDVTNNFLQEAARFGSAPYAGYGGTRTTIVDGSVAYTAHAFEATSLDGSTSGTFTVLQAIPSAEYLVVGGGGGGGAGAGGGGGAGGFLSGTRAFAVGAYPANVGAGGAGSTLATVRGGNGFASTLDTAVAVGGGGGASRADGLDAGTGGSGGGGAGQISGTRYLGAAGTFGQGNLGGDGTGPADAGTNAAGGGGGGAGADGSPASILIGGSGGAGVFGSVSGLPVAYAGGGGGGVLSNLGSTAGTGGFGGGGSGSSGTGADALAKTGGGGGGGGGSGAGGGGRGGSGTIVIRYPTGSASPVIDPNQATAALLIPGLGWANATATNWRDFSNFPTTYAPKTTLTLGGAGDYLTLPTPFTPNPDPYIVNVTLLLHFDGANGSTVFTDSSFSGLTVTPAGNVQISTAQSVFGASGLFDGNGDYLSLPNTSALDLGSGDFTIECWIYPTSITGSSANATIYGAWNQGTTNAYFLFVSNGTGGLSGRISFYSQALGHVVTSTAAPPLNTWTHLAVSKASGTTRMFINGTLQSSTSSAYTLTALASQPIFIGAYRQSTIFEPTGYWNGNIEDFRVTKGIGRYTANFAVPTSPYPDPSPPGTSGFENLDFTIEGWAWLTGSVGAGQVLFDTRPPSVQGPFAMLYVNSSTQLAYYAASADRIAASVSLNYWNHIAVARKSGRTALFLNGEPAGSFADTNFYGTGTTWTLGASSNTLGASPANGSLSNFRVTKGVARYEPTITLPTMELPDRAAATAGDANFGSVSLLLRAASPVGGTTFVDSSNNACAITRNGTPVISVLSPFADTDSIAFNGSTDFLTTPDSNLFLFTGDFTIEAWVYLTATPSASGSTIIAHWTSGVATQCSFIFYVMSDNRLRFVWGIGGVNTGFSGTSTTVPLNTWTHVAVTRSGSTVRLFVNGVQDATTGTASGSLNDALGLVQIGRINATDNGYLNGLLTDLRVTKGIARYTASFTPPTASFPTTTAPAPSDSLYSQTWALLRGYGQNNGTNFVDLGPSTRTFTRTGTVITSTAQSKWSGSSLFFNGAATGNFLTGPSLTIGTSDFTIECWFYIAGQPPLDGQTTRKMVICSCTAGANSNWALGINGDATTTGTGLFFARDTNAFSTADLLYTGTIPFTTWHHIAISRRGSARRLFFNGVLVAADFTPSVSLVGAAINVGRLAVGAYERPFNGYIDDFRVTLAGRYVGGFTPPSSYPTGGADPDFANVALLLPLAEPVGSQDFVDVSNNNLPVTAVGGAASAPRSIGSWTTSVQKNYGGAIYFDGTTASSLRTLPSDTGVFGTGDFTVEFWFWSDLATSANRGLFGGQSYSLSSFTSFAVFHFGTELRLSRGTAASPTTVVTATGVAANLWYHVAVERSAGLLHMFVNGSLVGTVTDTNTYLDRVFEIGRVSSSALTGYMQDVRAYRTAKYALTDSYFGFTTLLLHCEGTTGSTTFTDSSNANASVTANGNVQITTARSRFGTSSALFDGTGDYLSWSGTSFAAADDFTVEAWVYKTAVDASGYTVLFYGSGNTQFQFDNTTAGSISLVINGGAVVAASGTAVTANNWHHLAWTRQGTTVRAFVNGVLMGSGTSSAAFSISEIGRFGASPFGYEMNGNLDEIRITKGYARYTSNFTPPTEAFPDRPTFVPPTAMVK